MKIVISEIPLEGINLDLKEQIKFNDTFLPVAGQLKILKMGTEVIIKGSLRGQVDLQCSRCLKDFRSELSVPVDVVYHPVEELKGEDKYGLSVKELDMGFYSGEDIELADLIREQILLNLPMKPLCDERCKGICLQCGKELDRGDCGCNKSTIDPRFEALKRLLK